MRKVVAALGLSAVAALGAMTALVACSSLADSASGGPGADAGTGEGGFRGDADSPFGDAGVPILEANAIVLVHAASFPAFRICFAGTTSELPMPSIDLLPESNVVGVDEGAAVRLPATSATLGDAFIFPESVLRPLYPPFGGSGPTCQQILDAAGTKAAAISVGKVTGDLSRGVHALVLGGCRKLADDPAATVDRCGADWTAASGNLKLTTLPLVAYARVGDTKLSVQLLQLSPSLQKAAAGRALGLGFGSLDAGGAPSPFVEGAVPFGQPVPNPPATLDYAATDIGSYGSTGVFVTLGGPVDDAGALVDSGVDAGRQVLVVQSLAEIQRRSAPRSLPPDWFGVASSYVVVSVGEPDPRLGDGGIDDDARHALHLLAIPLATPDAGTFDGGL